jgi:hypothetical protein
MQEEWKAVSGYENYEVSSHGRVRNAKTGRIIAKGIEGKYRGVNLCAKGKPKRQVGVHRLVLETFVGPAPLDDYGHTYVACHYPDPTPSNCRLDNLVWGSVSENKRQEWSPDRQKLRASKQDTWSKNRKRIVELREENPNWSLQQIGDLLGVSRQYVHQVLYGHNRSNKLFEECPKCGYSESN